MNSRRLAIASGLLCLVAVAIGTHAARPATAAAAIAPPAGTTATAGTWEDARARAAAAGRPLMTVFTGSDWCPQCAQLESEILATPAFTAWAARSVVQVTLDFPMHHPLPPAETAANDAVARRYGIDQFPVVLLLDPDGRELGRLHYDAGGPGPWIAKAEALLAHR